MAAVSAATMPAAGAMHRASAVETTTRASNRRMVEVVVMATEVVVIFPAVMDLKARRIDATVVSVRGIPVNRIVGVAIAAPTAAAAVASVKASAEGTDTQADEDENWNCTSEYQVVPVPKELPK